MFASYFHISTHPRDTREKVVLTPTQLHSPIAFAHTSHPAQIYVAIFECKYAHSALAHGEQTQSVVKRKKSVFGP
jgi:hypothetical protein